MEKLTRQSLTDNEFLYLLGVCQWVFNSNVSFIIEMIDKEHHNNSEESWFNLVEKTAGNLKDYKNIVYNILGRDIYDLFNELVLERNAIFHSFPTGEKVNNYYIPIYRNDYKGLNIEIDKEYLKAFIKKNEKLSDLIYRFRGY